MALNKVQIASRSRMNPSRSRMKIQGQDSKFSNLRLLGIHLKETLKKKTCEIKYITFWFFLLFKNSPPPRG